MDVFNPYDYGKPVLEPHLFAGRGKLLSEIEYALGLATSAQPIYKNFAITGPRGIGKTSLLNRVAMMAERDHGLLASRVELNNELASNQAALFHQLLEGIVTRLRERQALGKARQWTGRLLGRTSVELEVNFVIGSLKTAQRDAGAQVPQESLRRSLARLSKEARAAGIPAIVICFDEADLLAQDETTLQALRNTFQQQEGYLLVLCGTEDLLEKLGKVFGAMKRFFDRMHLGPLDGPTEVRECLQAPLRDERAIVSDTFAAGVHELTGGAPYFVKLAAYHAYRAFKDGGGSELQLTPAIERAVLSGIQQTGEIGSRRPLDQPQAPPQAPDIDEPAARAPQNDDYVFDLQPTAAGPDESAASEATVIELVNSIILDAVKRRATDLHIVPQPDGIVVRVRVDGRLQPLTTAPADQLTRIAARLKIMGQLDISERRVPQDGRLKLRIDDRHLDCRIAFAPSIHGENITVTISDLEGPPREASALGLEEADLQRLLSALDRSSGLTLIAGPARSGKATTLYAAMAHLAARNLNVLSAEEQVRSIVRDTLQYEAKAVVGLTIYTIIRTALRHDPDVIAARPMTDSETAGQLTKIALAGRRALATFNAEDAPSALGRLMDLVEDRVSVANATTLVMAQRLLRKRCEDCRDSRAAPAPFRCPVCHGTGYYGQIGIYQLMPVGEEIRSAILSQQPLATIREAALGAGMRDLRDLALDRVRAGLTTMEEVESVLHTSPAQS